MKSVSKIIFVFCFLFLILPEFLGIELSASLPLITAARILILILLGVTLALVVKNKSFRILSDKKIWLVAGVYFVLRTASNLYYVTTYSSAVNNIFKMIAEEIVLFVLIPVFLETEEDRSSALKAVVYGCGVISAFGIAESLTGFRIADYLYTVEREMLNDHYIRLGILRATVTFGLSNFFAFYLTLMAPLIFFFWKTTGQKRYMLIALLNFFALMFTGCRGNILVYFFLLAVYPFVMGKKDERLMYFKRLGVCCCIVVMLILIQRAVSPKLKYYYDGTAKSLLNVVGFDFDLSEGAPEGVNGYGTNEKTGTASRLAQFSGIGYVMSIDPLFGLGAGAQNRQEIKYYWNGKWINSGTYDVGYVAAVCDEGIIGATGYMFLYIGMPLFYAVELYREKDEKKKMYLKTFLLVNVLYLICLLFAANRMPMYFFLNAIGLSFWASFKNITLCKPSQQAERI